MILMYLLQLVLPEKFRWFRIAAPTTSTAQAARHPALAKPWGELQAMPVALSRPDGYFTNLPPTPNKTEWLIAKPSWTALSEFIESLALDGKARSFLGAEGNWEKRQNHIFVIRPPAEVVVGIGPSARTRLYNELAQLPENHAQRTAFRFREEGFGDWFNESGLSEEKIGLAHQLLYTNEETICFADLAAFGQLSTPAECLLLLKSLSRVPTYLVKLHIEPDAPVDSLLNYWARFGNARDARILFRSLARADSDISISYFLPSFARLRLYTYPRPEETRSAEEDEIWTAMNFFNEKPNDRFFDDKYAQETLQADYSHLSSKERQLGDIVAILVKGKIHRMGVFIADDFVFVKNGSGPFEPWLLKKMKELITASQLERPFEVRVYRPKVPPRFAFHDGTTDIPD